MGIVSECVKCILMH